MTLPQALPMINAEVAILHLTLPPLEHHILSHEQNVTCRKDAGSLWFCMGILWPLWSSLQVSLCGHFPESHLWNVAAGAGQSQATRHNTTLCPYVSWDDAHAATPLSLAVTLDYWKAVTMT